MKFKLSESKALQNEASTDKLQKIVEKIQGLLMDAQKEASKLKLDIPFDEVNDHIGDVAGHLFDPFA